MSVFSYSQCNQSIFYCRHKRIVPSFNMFLAHLRKIVKIEEFLAEQNNKVSLHIEKWKLFVDMLA